MRIQGTCDPRFAELGELLEKSIESGDDVGASVAVTLDGEMVVDIWGGWVDEARTEPWREDTLVNCWSNTKTMAALSALVLVDRGELDVFAPVATYWPEFGANGKAGIEVRHLMSHTSGVAGWDLPVTLDDVYEPIKSMNMLAAQTPWWEPGTASGYHGLTYGHLLSEVIRRVTGQTVGKFFAQEIAAPLHADFHIGLDPAEDRRVSPIITPPSSLFYLEYLNAMDKDSLVYKYFTGPPVPPDTANAIEWRRSEICASGNGHGNARSVATVQSIVSHEGEYAGVRLLSPKTCELIFQEQVKGIDLCIGLPIRWGIGYALPWSEATPYLPDGRVCFWAGWGGSQVINDLDRRMTFAYMMNKMEFEELGDARGLSAPEVFLAAAGQRIGSLRSEALIRATYAALG